MKNNRSLKLLLYFLPHLSGLTHLPGFPYLHINWPKAKIKVSMFMGRTFESVRKNKFDYFFLQEHGLFNDSSKYGNVTVAELRVNELDGYVYLSIKLCLVVKKNNTGFIRDVIKMWKKFGNENVTTLQEFGIGECIFVVMAHSDSFLVDTKSYLVWYEGQRPGTGTSRSQTSNIVLRELLAERAWCTISIQAVCVTTQKGSWVKLLLRLISIVTRSSSHLV